VPSHGQEDTGAAAGDPSRFRYERDHFRSPALQPTVAIRLSLATQQPSASRLCPYAAANTTNDKDLMRWVGFRQDTNEASRATRTRCDGLLARLIARESSLSHFHFLGFHKRLPTPLYSIRVKFLMHDFTDFGH
jgi:hypothetical protein